MTQVNDILLQGVFDLRMLESVVDRSLHKAEFVADIIAITLEFASKHALRLVEGINCIGQLDFVPSARSLIFQDFKNFRCQQVAADNNQIFWATKLLCLTSLWWE